MSLTHKMYHYCKQNNLSFSVTVITNNLQVGQRFLFLFLFRFRFLRDNGNTDYCCVSSMLIIDE